jgi:hypothetical protein
MTNWNPLASLSSRPDLWGGHGGLRDRVKNAEHHTQRTRRVMGPDGVMVDERIPPIPFHLHMVDPAGHVVAVALANGFDVRTLRDNLYGQQLLNEKLVAGFLPIDECPVGLGLVDGTDGCEGRQATPCRHLQPIIDARREATRAAQAKYAARFQTEKDLLLRIAAQNAGLADAPPKGRVPK